MMLGKWLEVKAVGKAFRLNDMSFAVMAYMEMFGNCARPNTNEFLRHSVHTYNLLQAEWQQQEMSLTSTQSCSFSVVSSHSSGVLSGRSVCCSLILCCSLYDSMSVPAFLLLYRALVPTVWI